MKRIFLLILAFIFVSCGDDPTYSKPQMWELGRKSDPDMELVLPKDIESGIKCSQYGAGCLGGVTVKVKKLEMIFVEYENFDQAYDQALALDAYIIRNWLIDDVKGEPILEDFVSAAFQAVPARSLKID